MIKNLHDLREYLEADSRYYKKDSRNSLKNIFLNEHLTLIWRYIKYLRICEYFFNKKSFIYKPMYYLYNRKKNKLGNKLGFYINENVFGKGLTICHHGSIIINGYSKVGENCILHGNNCIGNNGKDKHAPIIGDNVELGIGAVVIGNIKIASNIKIGANAVCVKSFDKEGATLVGIPAKEKENCEKNNKTYVTAIISKLLIIFISLIISALVNRKLGVFLKGEYAFLTNLVSTFIVIFSLGLGQTYCTFRREYGKEKLDYFVTLNFFTSLISILISIFFFAFKNYNYGIVFFLTASGVMKNNLLYYGAIEDVRKRDINNIIYKVVYLILIVVLYLFFKTSLYLLLLVVFIEDLIIIIGTIRTYKMKPRVKGILSLDFKKIFSLGILCMVMHTLMTLNYSLDIIFLKKMTSSNLVGLYSVGVTLANMLWLIPDALKDVLVNKTSRTDSINEIVTVTKYSLYFSIFLIIGFVIFGKLFINILYGNQFLDSYLCTIILFVGCLSMIIYKLIHPIYIAKGKQIVIVKILSLSVIINIIANLILIPLFNMYGAAIASVCSYSICSLFFLYTFCKEYNVEYKSFFKLGKEDFIRIKNIIKK